MADSDFAQILITAKDATKAGFDSAKTNAREFQATLSRLDASFGGVASAAATLVPAIAGLGAVFGAAGITASLLNSARALDAFNDAADATGASVENLSALEDIALRNGESLDTVTSAVVKLNQALAAEAGSDKSKVIESIGLSAAELRKQDPAQALKTVANALNQYAEDGNRARIIQELFGKSARELAPFLKDLAEAGDLNATATAKQAQEAEDFNKTLFGLSAELTKMGRSIGSDVIPPVLEFITRMNEARAAGASWAEQLRQGFSGGASIEELKTSIADIDAALEKVRKRRETPGGIFSGGLFGLGNDIDETELMNKRIALVERLARAKEAAAKPIDAPKPSAPDVSDLLGTSQKAKKAASEQDPIEASVIAQQKEALKEYDSIVKQRVEGEKKAQSEIEKTQQEIARQVERYKDLADPVAKYIKQVQEVNDLEASGRLSAEEAFGARGRLYEEADKAAEKLNGTLAKTKDAGDKIQLTFESALENSILHFKSFGDAATSILEDVGRAILRANITKPLIDAVGAFDFKGAFKSFLPSADGNAFGQSGLIPFASGGVVDSPTFFKFAQGAGVMGEAGPEAILPLKRGAGGKLGVSADGVGGGGVVVNIINNTPAQVTTRQTSDGGLEVLIDALDAALGDRVSAGVGAISGAMQGRYGLRPSMGV